MANLIIPHILGPADSVELRYCLRSVEANLHDGEHRLVLAGQCPPWLKPDEFVPVEMDPKNAKVASIRNGVRAACEVLADEQSALYLDDDYYLLEPAEDVLPLYWGNLADHAQRMQRRHGRDFWLAKAHAATLLYLHPTESLSWELHRPLPLEPAQALDILPDGDAPFLWRSLYGNLADHYRQTYQAYDGKVETVRPPMGSTWLSSSWGQWRVLLKVLRTRFTEPARWEMM